MDTTLPSTHLSLWPQTFQWQHEDHDSKCTSPAIEGNGRQLSDATSSTLHDSNFVHRRHLLWIGLVSTNPSVETSFVITETYCNCLQACKQIHRDLTKQRTVVFFCEYAYHIWSSWLVCYLWLKVFVSLSELASFSVTDYSHEVHWLSLRFPVPRYCSMREVLQLRWQEQRRNTSPQCMLSLHFLTRKLTWMLYTELTAMPNLWARQSRPQCSFMQ